MCPSWLLQLPLLTCFGANVDRLQETKSPEFSRSPEELASSCVLQSSKPSQLDADYKSRLSITSQGRRDELKEWLTRCWESTDSEPPTSSVETTSTTAGVKRRASSVLETPADSTDDVFTNSSRSAGGRKSAASKVSKNNILLASLLATRASAEQPVVNTLSIGSIATVTPQISLLKRTPSDQINSLISDVAASSSTVRKSSSSSLSSVTSVSTAGDTATSLASSSVQKVSRTHRSSYCQNGSHGPNPLLTEANLSYQDAGVDMRNDVGDQDLVPTDVMDSLCGATVTSTALSLMDDTALISQLEQFFSSSPTGMQELENLLGDGYADLTSSLFGSDQADLDSQVPVTGIDSQLVKMESQSGSQSRQFSVGRTRGPGLLGQLLGNGSEQTIAESSFAATVTSDVLPQRPSSLAVSLAYFHRGMYNRTAKCQHYHSFTF